MTYLLASEYGGIVLFSQLAGRGKGLCEEKRDSFGKAVNTDQGREVKNWDSRQSWLELEDCSLGSLQKLLSRDLLVMRSAFFCLD